MMFNLKKYAQMQNDESWKKAWETQLRQVVINKITELKKAGVMGIEYHSLVKEIVPPPGGPVERAKLYQKDEATEEYLKMLSHIIATLPEEFKEIIYEPSVSGVGFEGHREH